jgi:ABC-type arginine/histidine transport system permease subunit
LEGLASFRSSEDLWPRFRSRFRFAILAFPQDTSM